MYFFQITISIYWCDLLQVQRHLTEVVLDQISPLVDLKYCFSYMEMGSAGAGGNIKKPFILEVIAEVN